MPFACVHVPDFAVEAVVRSVPAADAGSTLRQQAVAVLEGAPPLTRVMAANEKARAAGIELGMTRLQAESCAGVALRMRSAAQEESAHAALVDCACSFSPVVESTTPETVVLDITGLEQLFGSPARLARELARRLAILGMEGNVAVAKNPDTAIHAARGFSGTTVIPTGKEAERLGSLPVDVLGTAPEILEMLDRWGVRTLRALASLPPVPVAERLGQEGLRLQRLARGQTMRKLVPIVEPLHFAESMELEDAVELLDPLSFLLARLLEQICERLRSRALATQELRLRLELEVHADVQLHVGPCGEAKAVHQRTLRLPVPMQDSRVFLKLLQLDLRAHPPAAPVRKIRLEAEPARPRHTQEGLFSQRLPQPERLEVMLARLNSIVGVSAKNPEARVGSPEVLDTHRPDAFRIISFSPHTAVAKKEDVRRERPGSKPPQIALRVFRPPLPLRVELREGRPAVLVMRGEKLAVAASAGPWRNSGEWWNTEPWSRDEWDVGVKLEHGLALYRIFCDVRSGRWFVAGEYD